MALIDLSEEEIRESLRSQGSHVVWSANDYLSELDRRAAERHATALRRATFVLVGATIVYTVATLALAIVTWMKP